MAAYSISRPVTSLIWLARVVYSLWWVNPLVCAAKADNALLKLKLTLNYPFVYNSKDEQNCRWKRHMHVNAAASLLLRANDLLSSSTGEEGSAERLMALNLVEEPRDTPRSTSHHQQQQRAGAEEIRMGPVLRAPSGSVGDDEPDQSSDVARQSSPEGIRASATGSSANSPSEVGVLRRRTTLAEAGDVPEAVLTKRSAQDSGTNL
jgi:hypothetical protein